MEEGGGEVYDLFCSILGMFAILNIPIGMFRILNVPWANCNSYLEGGGLQYEEIIKSTLFCKVHYVLNSDIKIKKTHIRLLPASIGLTKLSVAQLSRVCLSVDYMKTSDYDNIYDTCPVLQKQPGI